MRNTASVVIIGAGVIGNSIAFHLAKQGCRDVIVIDKSRIGSGSTGKCTGGIRLQFSEEANVRLSMESLRFFEHFEEETQYPADFRQHGYLMLATTEEELNTFRRNVEFQQKLGVPVEMLSPEEVTQLVPRIDITDVLGATFCRRDGYADPYSVVTGFAAAARGLGVKIYEDTEVISINLRDGKINGLTTTEGEISAPVIINAAGAEAATIGKMVNVDIPVHPTRRHIFITNPVFNRSSSMSELQWLHLPLVIDFHNGFWFRREGPSLIFGMRNQAEQQGFYTTIDWDFFTDALVPAACHRLPILLDMAVMRAQVGLHPDTPDDMAIMGEVPDIEGLYLACGFNGHGFMHSPAIGRLMSELVLGQISSLPYAELFSLDRFHHQLVLREKAFI
jgi:sarcosine oxidase subunit beta